MERECEQFSKLASLRVGGGYVMRVIICVVGGVVLGVMKRRGREGGFSC
jgi:hypothetical protein